MLSRAIVMGTSYCSRGCIVQILYCSIWTGLAIVVGDQKGRCESLSLGRTMPGNVESSEVGYSRVKTIFLGLLSKSVEVNMICSISGTVNTNSSEGGQSTFFFFDMNEHLYSSNLLLPRRLSRLIVYVQRNPEL